MKLGMNLLLWSNHINESHYSTISNLKNFGFDGVEIPILQGSINEYKILGRFLKDEGLDSTAVIIVPNHEESPLNSNPLNRIKSLDVMKYKTDCCHAMGGSMIVGPFHSALGRFSGHPPTEIEIQNAAEVHRKLADYGASCGISYSIEWLNRFECYFLNTMNDAVNYVKTVGHSNFGTMYDTFHANIEEKNQVLSIRKNAEFIKHFHVSENDRGAPGSGQINFNKILTELKISGYDQWLMIEAFGRDLPELAAATHVWRDFSSPDDVCKSGAWLRNIWANT